MIAKLLPPSVVVVDSREAGDTTDMLPQEKKLVAGAVEKRRTEFAAGRTCARLAMARLGWPRIPILSGEARQPIWPEGIVGSITHCAGYCAAAMARAADLRSVGIDAEVNAPLPDGVERLVCTEAEREQARRLPGECWPTVIFSAKESVYKAWYPITGKWLDYLDAELTLDPDAGMFSMRIASPPPDLAGQPATGFVGRLAVTDDHVFTTVILPPARAYRDWATSGQGAARREYGAG